MRRFLLSLIAIGVLTAGCSTSAPFDLKGLLLVADSITVDDTSTPVAQAGQIALAFTDTGIAVIDGCNTMIGIARLTGTPVEVVEPDLVSAMMVCQETLMSQDHGFNGGLDCHLRRSEFRFNQVVHSMVREVSNIFSFA